MRSTVEAEFFDVEGLPVSIGAGHGLPYCACWDTYPPRPFDAASARRSGSPIALNAFEELIKQQGVGNPNAPATDLLDQADGHFERTFSSKRLKAFAWQRPHRGFLDERRSKRFSGSKALSAWVWTTALVIVILFLQTVWFLVSAEILRS